MKILTGRYFQYFDPQAIWANLARPWFAEVNRTVMTAEKPAAVLVPDGAFAAWLKGQLVRERLPAFGARFVTPSRLRSQLLETLPAEQRPRVALREDLRLLVAQAAGRLPDNAVAQAAVISPGDFGRLLDRMDAAGWSGDAFADSNAQELAAGVAELLRGSEMQTVFTAERHLARGWRGPPVFARLLAVGFSPMNQAELPLLRMLPLVAEETILGVEALIEAPHAPAWLTTLEAVYGAPEVLEAGSGQMDLPGFCGSPPLLLAEDLSQEGTLAMEQIERWLAEGVKRIGVVFSAVDDPLARELASRLAELSISHYDAIGNVPGKTLSERSFDAWAEFQRIRQVAEFETFLDCLARLQPGQAELCRRTRDRLRDAMKELLTARLEVLCRWPELSRDEKVMDFLEQWPLLPEHGSFAAYLEAARPALERLHWPTRYDLLLARARPLFALGQQPMARAAFLDWLAEVSRIPNRSRASAGREPFARVHLVTLEQAISLPWERVLFGGIVQGRWPMEETASALLAEETVAELNRRARRPAESGGEFLFAEGKAPLRAPGKPAVSVNDAVRRLGERAPTALTARLRDPADPARALAPAEPFLAQWYWETGELAAPASLVRLARMYREARPAPKLPKAREAPRRAYEKRRDPTRPFDEYLFGYRKPPETGLVLPCKAWEDLWERPAEAWFEHVLRAPVRVPADANQLRRAAEGIWLHSWLHPVRNSSTFQERTDVALWRGLVDDRAESARQLAAAVYAEGGEPVPERWMIVWQRTRYRARMLAETLAAQQNWPWMASEVRCEGAVSREGQELSLRGRIDLILAQGDLAGKSVAENLERAEALWLVDFKTGKSAKLSADRLAQGTGLQVALYMALLAEQTGRPVAGSILRPEEAEPHVMSAEDIPWESPFFAALFRVAGSGVVGDKAPMRVTHGRPRRYPLATTLIDHEILDQRWELTHQLTEAADDDAH